MVLDKLAFRELFEVSVPRFMTTILNDIKRKILLINHISTCCCALPWRFVSWRISGYVDMS